MMEKHVKIIELLEKGSLSAEEQKYIDEIIGADSDAARLVKVYYNLKEELPQKFHPDSEMIGNFILFENGEEPEDKLVLLLADKIKDHLKNCLQCRDEYSLLKEEYTEAENFISQNILKEERAEKKSTILPSFIQNQFSNLRYAVTALVIIGVAYFGLLTVSSLTTPQYKQNIFSSNEDAKFITRGRTSLPFQKGLDAAEKGNYDEALKYFEEDIKEHSAESSIFYSYFITGLTYLKSAEKDFLGMFPSYDAEKLNLAIKYLISSIEKNDSGNYDNLKLDAHYYLGRAYLLLENFEKAKEELNIVISSKGKFYNEAKEIISLPEMN